MEEIRSRAVLESLAKPVKDAFLERFSNLTQPQIEAIPKILEGKNVLLVAPVGTGKTESSLLPIFSNMVVSPSEGIRLLYITPLRALNRDLLERIDWWTQRLDLSVSVRHGDTVQMERRTQALSPPDILITTPETLQVILTGKRLRSHLKNVRWVIVDEIHELATDKRGAQLSIALERLVKLCGRRFQRIGLSATIGTPEKVARFLVGEGEDFEIVKVPVARMMKIDVKFPIPTKEDEELAEELAIYPEVAARLSTIRKLVESHESTVVFTNTRPLAETLSNRFRAWDETFPIGIHHGSLSRMSRISTEQGLKSGSLVGVVATSSLELGIDVGRIDLCIQYNSPREVTRLVQRIGRSGHRIGRVSEGVVIVIDSDDGLEATVIAKRAINEVLEEVLIPENSYDVLMHQIAGLAIEYGRMSLEEALKLIKKSYPFRNTTKEDLCKVINHMKGLGIVYFQDDEFSKPRNSSKLYNYYFNNLSMIPEEKQYLVVKNDTEEPIGLLDEEFIAEYGEVGTRFVLMGLAWEILNMSGDRVYVVKLDDYEGAIPSWVGDEIPVPFEVAQEVGMIRRDYENNVIEGMSHEEACKRIANTYGVEYDTIDISLKEVSDHLRLGIPVPTDKRIMIESAEDYTVIHIAGGLKVNRTLARLLAYRLSEKVGAPVSTRQDPYRIAFRSKYISSKDLLEVIKGLKDEFDHVAKRSIEASGLFRRRLVHVARKMGVLEKQVSLLDVNVRKLAEMLRGTPVYEEALNFSLLADFDLNVAKQIIEEIVSGKREVVIREDDIKGLSPLAYLTLREYKSEFETLVPNRLHRLIINSVRARLMSEYVTLICTSCWSYLVGTTVKDLDDKVCCKECGSLSLGVLKVNDEELQGIISRKGKPINEKEKYLVKDAVKTSSLVEKYGKAAIVALVGKNLEYRDVKDILEKERKISIRLIELIIEAEKKALLRTFK